MEELDLLKKNWNKAGAFEQISETEIYKMLHKKSSSIVRWILIISVLELGLGFLIAIIASFTKYDKINLDFLNKYGIYNYYLIVTAIMYGVVFYFIYNFYKMYNKISTDNTVKELIFNILKTRKVVKQYIAFNLVSCALIMIISMSFALCEGYKKATLLSGELHPEMPFKLICIYAFIVILSTFIVTGFFWLFYKLLYGILLKKLNRNYLELKKIDL